MYDRAKTNKVNIPFEEIKKDKGLVDQRIYYLLDRLNSYGLKTIAACSGHPFMRHKPYVLIEWPKKELEIFLSIIENYEQKVDQLAGKVMELPDLLIRVIDKTRLNLEARIIDQCVGEEKLDEFSTAVLRVINDYLKIKQSIKEQFNL